MIHLPQLRPDTSHLPMDQNLYRFFLFLSL